MSSVESIKRLLETLKAMKVTLRDTADPSISQQLDDAIAEIQVILEDENSELVCVKALDVLGKFFSCLPSIAKLIEFFNG